MPVPVAAVADGSCCRSGADDLLPILSYVVLQTGLPQLLSECAALEEFIHEGYVPGCRAMQAPWARDTGAPSRDRAEPGGCDGVAVTAASQPCRRGRCRGGDSVTGVGTGT